MNTALGLLMLVSTVPSGSSAAAENLRETTSPLSLALSAGGGFVAGRTSTVYRHPTLSGSGSFGGAAADLAIAGTYSVRPDLRLGLEVGLSIAPDIGGASVEWSQLTQVWMPRALAVATLAPGSGPIAVDFGVGIAWTRFGGATAAIFDPLARFDLEDANGFGPLGSLGVSYGRRLGRTAVVGASLRALGSYVNGQDVHTLIGGMMGALTLGL
jgi:hypothetical protein